MRNEVRVSNTVQLSEKLYQSYHLEVVNPGGHSSRPREDNAIYQLSGALLRIARYEFPAERDEITSAFFERTAELQKGELRRAMLDVASNGSAEAARLLSSSPYYNALLRTTCVATELEGGHAENALPQTARATVNCRLFPGSDPSEVLRTLAYVVQDDDIGITPVAESVSSPPSPLDPEVMGAIEAVTNQLWPGVPVIPTMSTGATDGLYLRNAGIPTYGVSGIFTDIDDARAHGRDERLPVSSLYEGRKFLDRLVRALSRSATAATAP
jgi:acetylornithine deacetylase/succinyl-diaminopimelate desuccinylase-like protein